MTRSMVTLLASRSVFGVRRDCRVVDEKRFVSSVVRGPQAKAFDGDICFRRFFLTKCEQQGSAPGIFSRGSFYCFTA